MSILSVSCGESFEPVTFNVTVKDAITKEKVPIGDYTTYKWYCTVKRELNDSDVDSITGGIINSYDDIELFDVEEDSVTIMALTQEITESLNRDLDGTEKTLNGAPVIDELFFDVWFTNANNRNKKPIQRKVAILKPVSHHI